MPRNPPHEPSWAIAAAVLLIDDCAKKYTTLTSEVLATGMSELGTSGANPEKTLRSDITKNHADIFEGHGGRSGYYQIGNERAALASDNVQRAVSRLAPVYLDQYKKLVLAIVHKKLDLSERDAERIKIDLEQLEKRLTHIARLYSSDGVV